MQLKKDSFVAKVAYCSFLNSRATAPEVDSLCRLFWKFLLGLFIFWPVSIALLAIVLAITCTQAFLFAEWFDKDGKQVPITWWPTIRGKRILPLWFLLAGVAWLCWEPILIMAAMLVAVVLIFALSDAVLALAEKAKGISVFELFKERLRPFKDKTCPIVTFVQ